MPSSCLCLLMPYGPMRFRVGEFLSTAQSQSSAHALASGCGVRVSMFCKIVPGMQGVVRLGSLCIVWDQRLTNRRLNFKHCHVAPIWARCCHFVLPFASVDACTTHEDSQRAEARRAKPRLRLIGHGSAKQLNSHCIIHRKSAHCHDIQVLLGCRSSRDGTKVTTARWP